MTKNSLMWIIFFLLLIAIAIVVLEFFVFKTPGRKIEIKRIVGF
jgi:hypothetical protein